MLNINSNFRLGLEREADEIFFQYTFFRCKKCVIIMGHVRFAKLIRER